MRGVPLRNIASYLGVVCDSDLQVSGYQVDSRLVQPGELFFAMRGNQVDGHSFLSNAAERGAVGAIVSKGYQGQDNGLHLVKVEDVPGALQELARRSIAEKNVPIIGLTGSVGKTTTKEFLATLLKEKFRVGKSPASYNSQITFPLNLLNRSGDEQLIILEMGMSMPGELAQLSCIAPPQIGVVTKIALSHAVNFPEGLPAIARAKAEIFSRQETKTAILDFDFLQYREAVEMIHAEKVTFSVTNPAADYFLSFAEGRYRLDERGVRAYQFDLPFKAAHLLEDFVAAVATVRNLGMDWKEIDQQVPHLHLPKMRFEQFEKSGVCFINDAYNANPASMRAALENIPEPKEGGKRIVVLATMKELGPFSHDAHAEIGRLAQKRADVLLVLGEEAAPLCEAYRESMKPSELFFDPTMLSEKLNEIIRPGDVVLLKGSRCMQLEKILEKVRVPENIPAAVIS
jgi:UDP-N-acetylmuramoyl-tripeptide--D-alanyl-D-alanine ligase